VLSSFLDIITPKEEGEKINGNQACLNFFVALQLKRNELNQQLNPN